MSKLDELIKELCPNGCEYRELKSATIMRCAPIIYKLICNELYLMSNE